MNNEKPWWMPSEHFAMALLLIGLFAWAFAEKPDDETMRGALIGAFAAAWGYYLGSSRQSNEKTEQLTQALDVAKTAQATENKAPAPGTVTATANAPATIEVTEHPDVPERPSWEK